MKKKNNHQLIFVVVCLLFYVGLSCPPNCLSCVQGNKCQTCQDGFYLTISSQCVSKSVDNCQVYNDNNTCSICASTFIIDAKSNQCIKDFSGCLKRDQKGVCIQCGFGTTLNIQGQCLGVINCAIPQKTCKSCLNGYNLTNNVCVYAGPQCQVVHSSGLCQQCKDGYILNGFQCLSKASNSVQNGNVNLIQKCNLYSQNEKTCLSCESGYSLFNNKCTSNGQIYNTTITQANNKIKQASNTVFVDTSSQFIVYSKVLYSLSTSTKDDYLDPTQREISTLTFQGVGTTPSSSDNCLIKDTVTLACKVCIDGYYYFNGLCKQKSIVCANFNTTTNKCEKCGDTFVLINGECLDAGCQEYLYAQCAKCKTGFQINQEDYCYDPYCSGKINGTCFKCLVGYQLDQSSQLCYKTIVGCKLYNQQKTLCQQCNDGYDISPNGVCTRAEDQRCLIYSKTNFQECIRCRDEFALMTGTCIDLYCKVFQTPRICNLCKQGYILHPSKFYCYDQNCVLYSNGTCINCANNYKLQDGFCVNILIGCNKVQPATQKCSSCIDPYRLADGKCSYPENVRCLIFVNSLCIQCGTDFALINGTCVDLKCQKQTFFNNYYACTQCKTGYNLTTQGTCYDQYCYSSVNGTCAKCVNDFVLGSTGLCVKSQLGCKNWSNSSNTCLQCAQGYNLTKNGVCSPPGSNNNNQGTNSNTNTTNPSSNQTGIIIVNPSQADNSTILTPGNKDNCKEFAKDNVTCTKCIDGRYFIRNSVCQPVPDICRGFDMKSGNCTSCDTGYAVYSQKSSYQDCYKKLQTSDPNCLLKNLNLFCIKCRPQYFIKGGFCYQADTQCKTFDLYGGDCLTCYDGFTLQNTKCIPLTQQSRCKKYDFQNVCVECDNGYYVDQNGVCKQVMSTCLSYEMKGGACLSCATGYWPSNGVCVKVRDPTPNCKQTNELGNCVECVSRYYLNQTSLTCKSVNQLCNDYNLTTGACLNCNSGFKLRSDLGLCVTSSSDDLCSAFNQTTGNCTKCQSDYVLATLTLKCIKQVALCSSYTQQTGECEKCQQPYALSFNECVQKTKRDTLDSNCLLGDTYNYCIKCKTGYYIRTGYCFKANSLCKTFNVNTGACDSCYDGFSVQNKLCVDLNSANNQPSEIADANCLTKSGSLCLKCKDRYFLSYDSQMPTCKKVSDSCLTYNEINGYCITCVTGYNLSTGGNCVGSVSSSNSTQQPTYVDVPQIFCKEYDMTMKVCHKCYNNYYYSSAEGTCKLLNLTCKTTQPTTGHCTGCNEGCVLNATKCMPSAQSIKYAEDILSYQNAALLNGDPNCVAISGSKCIQCQQGYYVDNSTNKCDVLSQWCDNYQMLGGKCNTCKLGAIMQNGICVKPVLGIDPYCSKYDGAYCVACMDTYKLDNYVCKKAS